MELFLSVILYSVLTAGHETPIDCLDLNGVTCRVSCPTSLMIPRRHCPFERQCCRLADNRQSLHKSIRFKECEEPLECRSDCPDSQIAPRRYCPFQLTCCSRPFSPSPSFLTTPDIGNDVLGPGEQDQEESLLFNTHRRGEPNLHLVQLSSLSDKRLFTEFDSYYTPGVRSAIYCKKYKKITKDRIYAIPPPRNPIPISVRTDNCLPKFQPLIVGGQLASEGEYPHMAALGYLKHDDIDYLCGGTLISDSYILTAAHCIQTKWGRPVVAMVGGTKLFEPNSTEVDIEAGIPHPLYHPPSCYHDIGLIQLKEKLVLSMYLRPACLPHLGSVKQPGSVLIATGWGKTNYNEDISLNLKKVGLKIINNKECSVYYTREVSFRSLPDGLNDNLLCAVGVKKPHHDTCQGDSGGPLQSVIDEENCMYEVVGITSFGKTCGTGVPAVYTKVTKYIPWIEEVVWP